MERDFFWDYIPFWVMTYTLAALAWTCVGRFLLGLMVPAGWSNYIWVAFRGLTDWAVRLVAAITPQVVPEGGLILLTAAWLFVLRVVLSLIMLRAGWAPVITPVGAS